MIRYIRGIYAMTFDGGIVIEDGSGIGFEVYLPVGSPLYRYGEGEEIKAYTYMQVKEDGFTLYGFPDMESLDMFKMLLTVNGIGAKVALAIMGGQTVDSLKRAIAFEDVKEITKAPGVGKKVAERMILELKDKIGAGSISMRSVKPVDIAAGIAPDARAEAISALINLGYSSAEAFSAVGHVQDEGLTSEEYIKRALKYMF